MKIETRSIEWVPHNERHGSAKDLFSIWFGANMHITTLVTGALCVTFGLNLFWSVVAIIVGNLIGALFMASHSAQGPVLGVPQMIQSRAQFGVIGAVIPLLVVIFMYLGFFASSGLLGAQTISGASSLNLTVSILVMNALTFVVTLYGHDLIHKMQKYLSWAFFITYAIATVIVVRLPIPASAWDPHNFNLATFVLSVALVATWQLAYAPYVADYSRYLPEKTSATATFWYSYFGTCLSTGWMMILGCLLTTALPGFIKHTGPNLAQMFGPFALLLTIIIILGQLSINSFNLYGAFMSMVTTTEPFIKIKVTPRVRGIFIALIAVIGTGIEILGQGSFLKLFIDFILFICYFLIPWTTINLLDFYVLRHGKYSVKDLFDLNGKYGKYNWITLAAYTISVVLEIPFMNTSLYVGPGATALGGADIAWAIGLVAPVIFYYLPMKKKISNSETDDFNNDRNMQTEESGA